MGAVSSEKKAPKCTIRGAWEASGPSMCVGAPCVGVGTGKQPRTGIVSVHDTPHRQRDGPEKRNSSLDTRGPQPRPGLGAALVQTPCRGSDGRLP